MGGEIEADLSYYDPKNYCNKKKLLLKVDIQGVSIDCHKQLRYTVGHILDTFHALHVNSFNILSQPAQKYVKKDLK